MSFFNKHNLIQYPLSDDRSIILRNIFKRVDVKQIFKNKNAATIQYDIEDGDTPESISLRLYDSVDYWWLVMMMNNIHSIYTDWCKTAQQLDEEVKRVYGSENVYAVHHYEVDGLVVTSNTFGAQAVSNYEYEHRKNEAKRRIYLLDPQYLALAEQDLETLLKG